MSHTAVPDEQHELVDTDVLDADWLAAPRRRSQSRLLLVAALAVLLVFLGGVEVQKRWGTSGSSGSATGPAAGGLPTGGFAGGVPSGGSGTPSGLGQQTTGAQSGSTDSGSTDSGSGTPAVIGTLTRIHGHTWTVQDLGGQAHTVTVGDRATLTRPVTDATKPIRTGTSVTVTGTTHGRTVVATAVTLR